MNTFLILLAVGAAATWFAGHVNGESIGQALMDKESQFSDSYNMYLDGLDTKQGNTVVIKFRQDRSNDKEQIFHDGRWHYLATGVSTSVSKNKYLKVHYEYYKKPGGWCGPTEKVRLKYKIKK